jgi:DNA polymerase III epsilon subunit-like protein
LLSERDKQKEEIMNRIVLDTETTGSVDNHKTLRVYDFGFVVLDGNDEIINSFNWVVREVFFDDFAMSSAYYADKLPQYRAEIAAGIREVKNFAAIKKDFAAVCKEYDVKQVWAYNAGFDRDALNATTTALSNGICEEFLPNSVVWCDIMQNAARLICDTQRYFAFALDNGYVSPKGNLKTSAECVYRFLTGNADFVEAHTGLKDAEIEADILHACRKLKRKMQKDIVKNAWRIPQKGFKEFQKAC